MTLTKEKILEHMRQESYRPLTYMELAESMQVEDHALFSKLLGQMEKDGDIVVTRKNRYGLPEMMNLVRGTLQVHPKGYAFLMPDNPDIPEIYIYGRDLNGAMHNDRVMVRLNHQSRNSGQKPEGEVIRAIRRANHEIVGTYKIIRSANQVIPDDPRMLYPIYVKPPKKLKLKGGEKVVVKLTAWPDKDKYPEGKITEVLGMKGDPGVDIISIVKKFGLRDEFPEAALKQARTIPQEVEPEAMAGRRDLRDIDIVTIDGDDAKDLDDAVHVIRAKNGFRLGVHIADVSHYVREDTALDKEAYKRGTSVYLVDRVLPMLPPELSNGICSLNAGVDRLSMTVLMDINREGEVISYEIFKSVIKVNERMTYKNVNLILKEKDPELCSRYRPYLQMFEDMRELALILRHRRISRGALDFDFPEAKVLLDEKGKPVGIEKRVQDVAENLIEEFMIRANETVALHLHKMGVPTLYRVHEEPDEEGVLNIARILSLFNYKLPPGKIEPRVFQGILNQVKGRPEERIISTMMLRSMKHARYTPLALGHFGLASPFYLHFTSPIRRYPDLLVHRILTYIMEKGTLSEKKKRQWQDYMPRAGEQCTQREIGAEEAERESVRIKMAEYMSNFIGEVFPAVIASVTAFGFFVELENTVEGLVHVSSLSDDYYLFDDRQLILIGKNTRRVFKIGDKVEVQLVKASVDDGKLDFELPH